MGVPRIILHYEILSRIAIYAALSNLAPRLRAGPRGRTLPTADSGAPAAIAGVQRSVGWILIKLYAKYPSATAAEVAHYPHLFGGG
jgi:hypothetical protein